TLRRGQATRPDFDSGESMHHSGGAWEETQYIYKPVIDWVKNQQISEPGFLSVGLGLGYNEMLLVKEYPEGGFRLLSFEVVPELRDFFVNWIYGKELHPAVAQVYQDMAERIWGERQEAYKSLLRSLHESGQWQL